MKELSIKEKAKRYDEALKVAKGLYANGAPDSLHLERMFPILKESEDDKIKKVVTLIIKGIRANVFEEKGIGKEDTIAWLEKQGEQKQDPCEDCDHPILNCQNFPCDKKEFFTQSSISKVEQKPVWSEDDEEMLEDIRFNYEFNKSGMTEGLIEQYNKWFEKIKSLKPQSKQEWSEEDKKHRNAAICACSYMIENFENSTKIYEDAIEWLKSLKPQPQWKPSEEQLNALDEVYKTHGANSVCRRIIFNLLEQLKKL